MLCLSTWSGQDLIQVSKSRTIPCYAKLGGKYVGKLRFCGSTSAYQVLQYIQMQASKLLKHAWRDFEDIMIWCDNYWLIPSGFAYRDQLTQEEEDQAWSAIQNAKRLEVMWDDNDEHANMVARNSRQEFTLTPTHASILGFGKDTNVPREIVGLLKRSKVASLECGNIDFLRCSQILTTGLSFLQNLAAIKKLSLVSIMPTDWSSCVNLEDLRMCSVGRIDVTFGMSCLRNLRVLTTTGVDSLPADFGGLNLTTFSFGLSNHLDLSNLVPHLVKMPNLEKLRYHNNRKTNTLIPTEVGSLVSLKILDLQENCFVGTIPSELGKLTNLTSLTIREFADFDLTCPQEVLNLNLAELVVERVFG